MNRLMDALKTEATVVLVFKAFINLSIPGVPNTWPAGQRLVRGSKTSGLTGGWLESFVVFSEEQFVETTKCSHLIICNDILLDSRCKRN